MATVSVSDVQDLTGTSLSETLIQAQIDFVISRVGDCLDSSYESAEADLIALYASAAFADMSDQSAKIKTEKAANGASVTYQDKSSNAFDSNQFGMMARAMDTTGCLVSLFPLNAGIRASGQSLKQWWDND